jgi:hypothetical protein
LRIGTEIGIERCIEMGIEIEMGIGIELEWNGIEFKWVPY